MTNKIVQNTWPDLRLPSQPHSITGLLAGTKLYCLVTDRGTCANNLPRVAHESMMSESRWQMLIASQDPNHYTPSHTVTEATACYSVKQSSSPAVTHMSHWQCRQVQSAKTDPTLHQVPLYMWDVRVLYRGTLTGVLIFCLQWAHSIASR